jgi:hypothetical protein
LADRQDWFFEESSAKNNVNIDKLFETVGRRLMEQDSPDKPGSNVVNPLAGGGNKPKKNGFCTLL